MDSLVDALNVCARLVYVYNETQEDIIDTEFYDKKCERRFECARKGTDKAINNINTHLIPSYAKQDWMNDKYAYVTWARDLLILNSNEDVLQMKNDFSEFLCIPPHPQSTTTTN